MYLQKLVIIRLSILFLFLNFEPAKVNCQVVNEDSLQKIIKETKFDTVRVDALNHLANYQIRHKKLIDIGFATLKEATELSKKINYTFGVLQGMFITGVYYNDKSEWENSISIFKEVIAESEKLTNNEAKRSLLMKVYNNVGGSYNSQGDFNNSLSYRLKAMEILEQMPSNSFNNKAIVYLNICSDYRQLRMYRKGIEYLNKTGSFFSNLNDRLKMEYYFEYFNNYISIDSIQKAKQSLDSFETGLAKYNLSDFQRKDYSLELAKLKGLLNLKNQNNIDTTLKTFEPTLKIANELKDGGAITEANYNIGNTYFEKKQYKESISFFKIAYDSSVKLSLANLTLKSATKLGEAYNAMGDKNNAAKYLSKALMLKTEIFDAEKIAELNNLEAKYQSQKKEKEITSLTLSNTQNELTVVKRNRLLVIGGISAAAFMLLLGLLYRNSKNKQIIAENEQKLKTEQIKFLERQQQVISLQSMLNGQETERTRIAKDLHDGLGGLFSTVKMYFSTLKHEQDALKENELFGKSYELIDSASEEVRRIAHNMMPEVLMKLGLIPAIQDMCSNISAGKLIQVKLQSYGTESRLNSSTEIMLYRIIQELLNNIIKHSKATEAIVQFNRDSNRLIVTVEDNGRGFNLQEVDQKNHVGLETIKSRVNYLNGNISIDSQQEVGTTVMMEFLINGES